VSSTLFVSERQQRLMLTSGESFNLILRLAFRLFRPNCLLLNATPAIAPIVAVTSWYLPWTDIR